MFRIVRQRRAGNGGGTRAAAPPATPIPGYLATLLDRAAVEQQRLTWEALQQYATSASSGRAALVARAWG